MKISSVEARVDRARRFLQRKSINNSAELFRASPSSGLFSGSPKINMPAPKTLTLDDEADDAGFGLETRHFFDGSDSEDSGDGNTDFPSYLPEDGRLRLRPNITLEGPEYSGQKSNRKEAFGEDGRKSKLLIDRMAGKRHRSTHSDSENISGEELDFEEDDDEPQGLQLEDEMEALTKEYTDLREEEDNLLKSLKEHGDEDLRKGQAVRNQQALWDKALEMRICLQKVFSSCNQLPQASVRSYFCKSDDNIDRAYSELASSAHKTLDCLLDLQEVLIEKNSAISEAFENGNIKSGNEDCKNNILSSEMDTDWARINTLHTRIVPFRNHSVDKWHRKTQLSAGAAAIKNKLRAFNQSITQQVSAYMRDPTSMIKRMQQMRSSVHVLGDSPQAPVVEKTEISKRHSQEVNEDGDPELLDDSEFYQLLLQEFLESTDPTSLGTNIHSMKKIKNKKRKAVDRRASKSRKIRYNVHEKIVNFMAPEPMVLPPMAPKLFSNLFGQHNAQPV